MAGIPISARRICCTSGWIDGRCWAVPLARGPDRQRNIARLREEERRATVTNSLTLREWLPASIRKKPRGRDVIDTADLPTGYNSPIYARHRPAWDAASVALTRRAGGIVMARLQQLSSLTGTPARRIIRTILPTRRFIEKINLFFRWDANHHA